MTVASGRPTLIYRFFVRCGLGSRPYISAVADHGAATTKDGTASICGNSNEPVTELWYQSEPKFHGSDTITVLPYRVIFNVSIPCRSEADATEGNFRRLSPLVDSRLGVSQSDRAHAGRFSPPAPAGCAPARVGV